MRVEGWEKRLSDYLQSGQKQDFVWGERDCVLLAVDVVLILTGIDLENAISGGIRGTYTDRDSATSRMQALGVTPQQVFDAHFARVKPSLAARGDIVYRKRDIGGTFGIVFNGKAVYRAETGGFIFEPISLVKSAWHIP